MCYTVLNNYVTSISQAHNCVELCWMKLLNLLNDKIWIRSKCWFI